MHLLFILLGCHITYLLNNRIARAVHFAKEFNSTSDVNSTNIDWFLSGGIKNPLDDTITEAEKMAAQIYQHAPNNTNKWNYIYDTTATNTAENFIMVNEYLTNTNVSYTNIYVITSDFHHTRAKKIAEQIITDTEIQWILADAELDDSRYWEQIHIKNVDTDVRKAVEKMSYQRS
jgi:uncharacterized SAM-binding protein YcdF (DUF218 family)